MLKKALMIISLFLGITAGSLTTSALVNNNVFPSMNPTVLRITVTVAMAILFVLMSLLFSDKFVTRLKRSFNQDANSKNSFYNYWFNTRSSTSITIIIRS